MPSRRRKRRGGEGFGLGWGKNRTGRRLATGAVKDMGRRGKGREGGEEGGDR